MRRSASREPAPAGMRRSASKGSPRPSSSSPRPSVQRRNSADTGDTESITVGVRLRPLVAHENEEKSCLQIVGNVVQVTGDVKNEGQQFAFDAAMDSSDSNSRNYVSQEKCYQLMGKRMKDHMMKGFNTCLFCYGQTGTGKTTTIMGQAKPVSEQGLLMRLLYDVFTDVEQQKISGYEVDVSVQMLEVYNEKLRDLIVPENESAGSRIEVHVHPVLGCYLKGATTEVVDSLEDCIKLIGHGNTMKSVRATAMNNQSSRGHTIFKLNMERRRDSDAHTIASEVYFCDLAGRENMKTTQVTGDGRIELSFINKSLMFLANCIQKLGQEAAADSAAAGGAVAGGRKRIDMSKFRSSKLTLLLSNALSGNSKTAMIGTLSPSITHFDESYSTLKFASTVKSIKLTASAASAVDKEVVMKQLQDEVQRLKEELANAVFPAKRNTDVEHIAELQAQLETTKGMKDFHEKTRDELRLESMINKGMRREAIQRMNISPDGPDAPLPHLANYSDDPFLAFMLVFHIPPDKQEYSAGSAEGSNFRLPPGPGVCSTTCHLRNTDGKLCLRPAALDGSEGPRSSLTVMGRKLANIQVNDTKLEADPVALEDMDKIIFGRSTVFFVFKKRATPESLAQLQAQMKLEESGEDSGDAILIRRILGSTRAANTQEVAIAQEYLERLRKKHRDSEGQASLRMFLHSLVKCKKQVGEANCITRELRPSSGLRLELSAQAPVMGFGYSDGRSLPQICVRLLRRSSPAKARWLFAVQNIIDQRKGLLLAVRRINKFASSTIELDLSKGQTHVLHIWPWSVFEDRLEAMRDLHEAYNADRNGFKLPTGDPLRDPWYVTADSHDSREKRLQRANSMRTQAIVSSADLEVQLEEALREKAELESRVKSLQTQLHAVNTSPAVGSPSTNGGFAAELQRCLELSKENHQMAEKLVLQRSSPTIKNGESPTKDVRKLPRQASLSVPGNSPRSSGKQPPNETGFSC